MLSKLIKHEYHSTYKIYLSCFAGLLGITLLTILFSKIDLFTKMPFSGIRNMFFVAMIIGCIALPIGALIYIMYRFYKNLFSDEGYLTFTLPVTRAEVIAGKFIPSCSWLIISGLVSIGCFFLYSGVNDSFSSTADMTKAIFGSLLNADSGSSNFVIFSVVFYLISYVVYIISFFYLAFAFGQFLIPNHKILGAVVGYFALQLVSQIVSVIIIGIYMLTTSFSLKSPKLPTSYFFVYALLLFALSFLWLFLTNLLCKKKLNLS